MPGILLFSLALASYSLTAVRAVPLDVYPIDWASVPATSGSKNLTANCICDLLAFSCDLGCCCDPDCEPAVTNATRVAGSCLPEGPPEETLDYCVPDSYVRRVNLPSNSDFYDITVQAADNKFWSQLLCITNSRNPNLGDYYPDPAAGDTNGNAALVPCPKASVSASKPGQYQLHTPVYVTRTFGNGQVKKVPLTVPYPALSDECSDAYAVGFMDNLPASQKDVFTSCARDTFDPTPGGAKLQQLCTETGVLSPTRYSQMQFYSRPTADASSLVTVVEVLYLDPSDGSLTPLALNTSVSYFEGVCYNALAYTNITVYYTNWVNGDASTTATGDVAQVSVSLIVTDVSRLTPQFLQHARVNFLSFQAADTRVLQAFSGNPGYLKGYAVLAGGLVSDPSGVAGSAKTAIQRLTFGLPLPAAGNEGTCAPAASTPVRFGYNTTASCGVELTGAQLQAFCTSQGGSPQFYLQQQLGDVYDLIIQQAVQLGIWGNSNFTDPSQWIRLSVSNFPFAEMIYTSDGTCSNVVVGYDLRILTGVAFSANNLQNKVLYATLCFRTATWAFPESKASDQAHRFYLTSTVSFVGKEQIADESTRKPTPPLLAPLPEDIFYPFVTSHATTMRVGAGAGGALLLLLAAVLALLLPHLA